MRILAIETSCDETGIALLEASGRLPIGRQGLRAPKFKVVKNLVASQIKIHAPFGGVVPNLAKREHLKNLPILFEKLTANSSKLKADLITVTVGPGLEPALWAGITFAQDLAKQYKAPLVGANHLEGHLYSFLLAQKTAKPKTKIPNSKLFPAVALIVSGGHTILLLVKDLKQWKKLGETRDDAVGEAFDKVARMLELPYPGGPEIEKLAAQGDSRAINFPRPMLHEKNYNFSFSGLKTAVLYHLRDNPKANKADVAASFQQAALDVLTHKTMNAAWKFGAKSVMLSGGVAANKALRKRLQMEAKKARLQFFVPPLKYNTDNAAMIGIAGYFAHIRKKNYKLEAKGNLNIEP